MKQILFIFLSSILSFNASMFAQKTIGIEFNLKYMNSDKGVPFANVVLIDQKDTIIKSQTNEFGKFSIVEYKTASDSLKILFSENEFSDKLRDFDFAIENDSMIYTFNIYIFSLNGEILDKNVDINGLGFEELKNTKVLINTKNKSLRTNPIIQNKINIELHAYISSSDRPLKFALVYLIDNKDTICQTTTDQFGNLAISDLAVKSDSLKCVVRENDPRYINQQIIILKSLEETNLHELNVGLLKRLFDNFDTGAYFKENEFRNFENFEIYGFRKMLDEIPHLCIKMNLRQLPNESKRLAKKRIKQFENYLFSQGVNMNQVLFTSEIQLVQFTEPKTIYEDWETQNPYLNSPGFQPTVYSMEGPCR